MRHRADLGNILFRIITYTIIFCIFFPILITIIVSFNTRGFVLPPSGLTLHWYIKALTYREFISGMYVSFIIALLASGLSTVIGTLTSFALVRYRFKGRDLINTFFMSPLMMPVVIIGLAIYSFLVKIGISDSVLSLIIGHVVLITPFSIRTITASLQNFDRFLEEAAMNVGAGVLKTFFFITLPIIKTGIIAGMMMAFILSWNNFALSVFLASPGWTPLPLQLYSYIKFEFDPTGAALSTVLVLLSGIAIVVIDRLIGLSVVLGLKSD